MTLPVDFVKKFKVPGIAGNAGYPYRISATDLMDNFRYLDKKLNGLGVNTDNLQNSHPFQIIRPAGVLQVSAYGSSVTDGTNGVSVLIDGLGVGITDNGNYIVLEAQVTDLVASDWKIITSEQANEIDMDGESQTAVRAVIGRIVSGKIHQALFTALRLSHGFLNGSIVRVLEAAPTHQSAL